MNNVPVFARGKQARVRVDQPNGTPFVKGQIVLIGGLARQETGKVYAIIPWIAADTSVTVQRVETQFLDIVDVPHPDSGFRATDEVREEFEDMLDLDPVLRRYAGKSREEVLGMLDARDALGAAPVEPAEPPLPPSAPVNGVGLLEHPGGPAGHVPPRNSVVIRAEDVGGYQDVDGDTLVMTYWANICPEHGLEGFVRFAVNDKSCDVPVKIIPAIQEFLNGRMRKFIADRERGKTEE